jgi:hypothetical protein
MRHGLGLAPYEVGSGRSARTSSEQRDGLDHGVAV